MTAVASDVHFRVTGAFSGKLIERAAEWGVSRHQAARRLAALSNFNLSLDEEPTRARFDGNGNAAVVEVRKQRGYVLVSHPDIWEYRDAGASEQPGES